MKKIQFTAVSSHFEIILKRTKESPDFYSLLNTNISPISSHTKGGG